MAACKNPLVIYCGNDGECANCGSVECAREDISPVKRGLWGEKICECGANKLLGPENKHQSIWCDLYVKP